jgi:hydroxymethylpyrimidine kinase/phosphomethylpyrimidine kinase/thiamine-phosphate diphosphorylase
LSIAGSDSGGGAGIQADIKACTAAGVFSSTAVTALTAQNTQGVSQIHSAPSEFIKVQIKSVLGDIGADSIKTGMLPCIEAVEAVADELASMGNFPPLIVDPVLVATSGDALAEAGVAQALAGRLFPLATLITPNINEASVLLGGRTIADVDGMRMAAQDLHALGPQWVLVKGGHLPLDALADGEDLVGAEVVVDVLYDGTNFYEMRAPYIRTQNSHGTGCTLAAYIAAEIAKGSDVPSAVRTAKKYVWRALERSVGLLLGSGPQRPLNHSYRIADWRAEIEREQNQEHPSTSRTSCRVPCPVDLRLYAVTDPSMIDSSGLSLPDAVSAAIEGGATVIQLREKNCGGKEFTTRAAAVLERCRSAGIPLLINDRVDVALAIGADGVHVGQDDVPAEAVRKLIGPDAILGVSVKTVEQAVAAEAAGADYLGAGAIFSTSTKDSSVIGVEGFTKVCQAVNIPVVAIGGVGAAAVNDLVDVGAAGVAVVSAVFATGKGSDGVKKAAGELRQVVDEAFALKKHKK